MAKGIVVSSAEAEDPKALRKRVAELEKKLYQAEQELHPVDEAQANEAKALARVSELEAWGKEMEGELARLKHELARMAAYFTQLGGEFDRLSKTQGVTLSRPLRGIAALQVRMVKRRELPLSAGLKARLEAKQERPLKQAMRREAYPGMADKQSVVFEKRSEPILGEDIALKVLGRRPGGQTRGREMTKAKKKHPWARKGR